MADYLPIAAMLILSTLFAAGTFAMSSFLRTQRATTAKSAPYECGIVPSAEPAERFPVRFYLVAMIFVIFDIEIIFLYPWAVIFRDTSFRFFGLIEMVVFAIAVFVSFLFLISQGALDWGPAKRLRPPAWSGSERTSESTIRRVSASDEAA